MLSPCPPGWKIDPSKSVQVTRMATQSKIFPIYEVEYGKYIINIHSEREIFVKEYLQAQGRFREMNDEMIETVQKRTDRKWKEHCQAGLFFS